MLEPAESSTPVSLLAATLGFAACGLLLLVVNGQNLRAAVPKANQTTPIDVGERFLWPRAD